MDINDLDILSLPEEFPSNFINDLQESEDLMNRVGEVFYEGRYIDVETQEEPFSIRRENSSLAALDLGNYTIEHVDSTDGGETGSFQILDQAGAPEIVNLPKERELQIGIEAHDVTSLLKQFEETETTSEKNGKSPVPTPAKATSKRKTNPQSMDPLEVAKKITPAKRKSAILIDTTALPLKSHKKKPAGSSIHSLMKEALNSPVRSLPGSRSATPDPELAASKMPEDGALAYLSLEHDYCIGFGINYSSPSKPLDNNSEKMSLEQRRELYRTKYKVKKKNGSNCSTPQSQSPNRTESPVLKPPTNGLLFDKIPDYFAEKLNTEGMSQDTQEDDTEKEENRNNNQVDSEKNLFNKLPSYFDFDSTLKNIKEENKENESEEKPKTSDKKPVRRKNQPRQLRKRKSRSQSCGSSASACSSGAESGSSHSRSRSRSRTSHSRSRSNSRSPRYRSKSLSRSRSRSNSRSRSRSWRRSRSRSRSASQVTSERCSRSYNHSPRSRSKAYSPDRSRSRSVRSRSRRRSFSRSRRSRSRNSRSLSTSRSRSRSHERSSSKTRRKRSRSISSRSRSRSASPSSRPRKRPRLKFKGKFYTEAEKNLEEYEKGGDQVKEWQDRRVIYVGNIPEDTTRQELYSRFSKFGGISKITLHFRDTGGDHYAFITFDYSCDAFACIKAGNDPNGPQYDLCFGGRRNFCKTTYEDLDSMNKEEKRLDHGYGRGESEKSAAKSDFDLLLQEAMKGIKR